MPKAVERQLRASARKAGVTLAHIEGGNTMARRKRHHRMPPRDKSGRFKKRR